MTKTYSSVFLSGWGFSAAIWQAFLQERCIDRKQCFALPGFHSQDEAEVLESLYRQIHKASVIHAWSLSALWLVKLLALYPLKLEKIYFYAPAFKLNLSPKKAENFITQFTRFPKKFKQRFLQRVTYGAKKDDTLMLAQKYCLLDQENLHRHHLHHLSWMINNPIDPDVLMRALGRIDYEIFVGNGDVIVDTDYLASFDCCSVLPDCHHLKVLSHVNCLEF